MSTILQQQKNAVLECPHCGEHFRTRDTSYRYVDTIDNLMTTTSDDYVYICPDCNGQVPETPDTKTT